MGGTSTDVFCVASADDQTLRHVQEQTEIAGLQLLAPRLPIETVAAGGGSVLEQDGDRLRVGPRSAGARPGPACYRAGGPLTITDANVLLGRLHASTSLRCLVRTVINRPILPWCSSASPNWLRGCSVP